MMAVASDTRKLNLDLNGGENLGDTGNDEAKANVRAPPKRKHLKKKKKQVEDSKQNAQLLSLLAKIPKRETPQLIDDVAIEYVAVKPSLDQTDPNYEEFSRIFAKFDASALESAEEENKPDDTDVEYDVDEEDPDAAELQKLSKKELKQRSRMSLGNLKQLTKKPEVVDIVDTTASDPKILIMLKALRNTVPVPVHWSQKRKFLQSKRGIEKTAFILPEFIKDTGIMQMREAIREKEEARKLKGRQREKVQPKLGKLDIDYQRLHDAFFRYQTKPKMSAHGEMYFEGKEYEAKFRHKRPGILSDEIKAALNMPPFAPPPWLLNMQRYGPPPAYPNLRIAGLNSPIPEGAEWGLQPGGWGKPPVDEYNRPVYGDVFGTQAKLLPIQPYDKTKWGELEWDEEEDEQDEELTDDENTEAGDEPFSAGQLLEGIATPGGAASVLSTVPSGIETPEHLELRKDLKKMDKSEKPETVNERKQLYQVLEPKETKLSGFLGTTHVYDVPSAKGVKRKHENGGDSKKDEKDAENAKESKDSDKNALKEDLNNLGSENPAVKKRKKSEKKKEFKF